MASVPSAARPTADPAPHQVSASRRALVAAGLALVLAVATSTSSVATVAVVTVAVVAFGLGWPTLLGLPSPRGSSGVVVATGVLGIGAVVLAGSLVGLIAVIAFGVIAAFVHEMGRGQRRPLLTESLAGTVTGAVAAVSASGWVAIGTGVLPAAVALAAAAAVGAAALCVALPVSVQVKGGLAIGASAVAGGLVGVLEPTFGAVTAAAVGVGVGMVTAAIEVVFDRYPTSTRPFPSFAIAALPVVVVGIPVYGVVQLLGT